MVLDIILLVVMLAFSALFSGIEIAFVSTNRLKIELKSAQGDKVGMRLSEFVKRTPRVITTILVGNNLALVLYGIFIANVLTALFTKYQLVNVQESPFLALVLQTLISTLIILFFGEYLPKAFFRLKAEQIMFSSATTRFLQFFYWIFSPLVAGINWLSAFFLKRVFRLKFEEEELVFGKDDLNLYVRETMAAGREDEDAPEIDAEMFENAMEFNETKVREFMVPRTELHALPAESTIDELIDVFVQTGHSKILIFQDNLDEILGFVHSRNLFERPSSIKDAIQPLLTVPESMAANVLLSEFTKNRKTIALVVDEFGGTAGLATIEDLVEEVFGEIEDEHDEAGEEDPQVVKINDKTYEVHARVEVDDLIEDHHLDLPEGEYTTLGGLIFHHAERIPKVKEELFIDNFKFTITEADENRLVKVRLEILNKE